MERLTQWFGSSRLGREAGMAPKYDGVYTEEELINVLLSHLAAYEDTGLDPDGIQALKVTLGRREGELLTDFDGIPLARMLEIAKAEKEGRLVILPCKVGDTVYFASWFGTGPHIVERVIDPYFYTRDARNVGSTADFSLKNFGEIVFRTRQEAEEALRKEEKPDE